MNLFDSLSISGSALLAERQRSEVIAANMANAQTTHTEAGGPFRRREVVFETPWRFLLPASPCQHRRVSWADPRQRANLSSRRRSIACGDAL